MNEGTTIGFWLPLPREEATAALDKFREIAAGLGYLTEKGARPGEGHPGKLLVAISRGECIVIPKGDSFWDSAEQSGSYPIIKKKGE